MFALLVAPTSESMQCAHITVLLDPENVWVAVGISLLSHTQAEIYTIAYVLPVYSSHVWFTGYADIGEYSYTSPTVLLDPENVGVAVGISLLSHTQAEIYDIAYVLPVSGSHLWFTSHPDVGEYSNMCHRVARLQNWGCCRKFGYVTFESRH